MNYFEPEIAKKKLKTQRLNKVLLVLIRNKCIVSRLLINLN